LLPAGAASTTTRCASKGVSAPHTPSSRAITCQGRGGSGVGGQRSQEWSRRACRRRHDMQVRLPQVRAVRVSCQRCGCPPPRPPARPQHATCSRLGCSPMLCAHHAAAGSLAGRLELLPQRPHQVVRLALQQALHHPRVGAAAGAGRCAGAVSGSGAGCCLLCCLLRDALQAGDPRARWCHAGGEDLWASGAVPSCPRH
jgi:hypothetical protein